MRAVFVGCLALASLCATQAQAYCSEPNPPGRYSLSNKPRQPDRPYCAQSRSCSEGEIRNYRSEIERYEAAERRYAQAADAYIRGLTEYVESAVEYAKCEARAIYE